MHKITLAVACLALAGCAASINTSRPAGRDAEASANALFNTTVISQIHKGQTRSEVRGIMRHDAEKHEIAGLTESWGYLTSHKNKMITWITFTDHTVSSLTHEILERD
jgi:predicted small secreted protein